MYLFKISSQRSRRLVIAGSHLSRDEFGTGPEFRSCRIVDYRDGLLEGSRRHDDEPWGKHLSEDMLRQGLPDGVELQPYSDRSPNSLMTCQAINGC